MPDLIPAPKNPPPLRVPTAILPPYRYIPGLQPHPFRHVGGHMYTDGSPPKEMPWASDSPWHQDERYLVGADLFDHRYYWEAHEAWEALWHFAEPDSNMHRLLQSLIQYAAATLKNHVGHQDGALRLFERATARIDLILETARSPYKGIDLRELTQRVSIHLDGGPWPLLPMERP